MRIRLTTLLLLGFIVVASTYVIAEITYPGDIVLMGDSIYARSTGISMWWDNRTPRDIQNKSKGGVMVTDWWPLLDARILVHCPDSTVIVEGGFNDAYIEEGNEDPRVTPGNFTGNLTEITQNLTSAGCTVILATMIPQDYTGTAYTGYGDYNARCAAFMGSGNTCEGLINEYNRRIIDVADTEGVDWFNSSAGQLWGITKSDYLEADGLHLTAAGQDLLSQDLQGFIERDHLSIEDLTIQNMKVG